MRLEIQKVKIDSIVFGNETNVTGTQLTIYKDTLIEQLKELSNIKDIKIDIAMPGEKKRIIPVKMLSNLELKSKETEKASRELLAASHKWATESLNL